MTNHEELGESSCDKCNRWDDTDRLYWLEGIGDDNHGYDNHKEWTRHNHAYADAPLDKDGISKWDALCTSCVDKITNSEWNEKCNCKYCKKFGFPEYPEVDPNEISCEKNAHQGNTGCTVEEMQGTRWKQGW